MIAPYEFGFPANIVGISFPGAVYVLLQLNANGNFFGSGPNHSVKIVPSSSKLTKQVFSYENHFNFGFGETGYEGIFVLQTNPVAGSGSTFSLELGGTSYTPLAPAPAPISYVCALQTAFPYIGGNPNNPSSFGPTEIFQTVSEAISDSEAIEAYWNSVGLPTFAAGQHSKTVWLGTQSNSMWWSMPTLTSGDFFDGTNWWVASNPVEPCGYTYPNQPPPPPTYTPFTLEITLFSVINTIVNPENKNNPLQPKPGSGVKTPWDIWDIFSTKAVIAGSYLFSVSKHLATNGLPVPMVFPTNFLYAAPNNQAVGYRVASFRTNRSPNAVLYGVDSFSSAVGLSLPNTWANPPLLIGPPPTF